MLDTDELDETLASGDTLLDVHHHSHLVHTGLVLVDGTHVDGIGVNEIEELDEDASI